MYTAWCATLLLLNMTYNRDAVCDGTATMVCNGFSVHTKYPILISWGNIL